MELISRESAAHRCPYCHDMLDDGAALLTCEGCDTRHHEACAAELGRCSILGCASLPAVSPRGPSEASEVLAIRRRVRERARRFVRAQGTEARAQPEASSPAQRLRLEILAAQEALEREDYPLLHAARREIDLLERALEFAEYQAVWSKLGLSRTDLLDASAAERGKVFRQEWVREGEAFLRIVVLVVLTAAVGLAIALLIVQLGSP